MAFVQRLNSNKKAFAAVAETRLCRVLNEGGTGDRIDAVFDDYREESTKNTERENRGNGSGSKYRNKQTTSLIIAVIHNLSSCEIKA